VYFVFVCLLWGWVLVNNYHSTYINLSNSKALGFDEITDFCLVFMDL